MNNIALLALEASDATVVLSSISLVFGMLVALCLIITIEGKIFDAKNGTNKKTPAAPAGKADNKAAAATAAPANVAKAAAAAPAANGGIPGEVVAAIAAAIASLDGNFTIRGIRRKQGGAGKGHRRGAWGNAGVRENTTPFM